MGWKHDLLNELEVILRLGCHLTMQAVREGSYFTLSKKRSKWNVWLRKALNLSNSVSNFSCDSSALQEAKLESQFWASTASGAFEMRSQILQFKPFCISAPFLLLFEVFFDAVFASRGWMYTSIHLSISVSSTIREIQGSVKFNSYWWEIKTLSSTYFKWTVATAWLINRFWIALSFRVDPTQVGLPEERLWSPKTGYSHVSRGDVRICLGRKKVLRKKL